MTCKWCYSFMRYKLLPICIFLNLVSFLYILKSVNVSKSNTDQRVEGEDINIRREYHNGVAILANASTVRHSLFQEEQHLESPSSEKQERLFTLKLEHLPAVGPGEKSTPVKISRDSLTDEEKESWDAGYKRHGFNAYVSDVVSVHRKLKDIRPPECLSLKYPPVEDLEPVSIIIPFKNELLSILIRTVYSILEITPPSLVTEVILVDDGSTSAELKNKLNAHKDAIPNMKIIHLAESKGLMIARQTGIDAARSEVIVVLDSHMEVTPGWLEPLLYRLQQNPKALLNSNMGSIDRDTFATHYSPFGQFVWLPFIAPNIEQCHTMFKKEYIKSRNKTTDPLLFASITGMMIVMRKDFFQQLGGFDPGMRVWGSEQMELSVKVWMCGGTIELIPCSYAVHMFRDVMWRPGVHGERNKRRFMEVWMDEYKDIFFEYLGGIEAIDPGNLTERFLIRERNKCKTFQYYLDEVSKFAQIYLPINRFTKGRIKNTSKYGTRCLDSNNPSGSKKPVPIMYPCHDKGWPQMFELSAVSDFRHMIFCLYPDGTDDIIIKVCLDIGDRTVTKWDYTKDNKIVHRVSGLCLTVVSENSVNMKPCINVPEQTWEWTRV